MSLDIPAAEGAYRRALALVPDSAERGRILAKLADSLQPQGRLTRERGCVRGSDRSAARRGRRSCSRNRDGDVGPCAVAARSDGPRPGRWQPIRRASRRKPRLGSGVRVLAVWPRSTQWAVSRSRRSPGRRRRSSSHGRSASRTSFRALVDAGDRALDLGDPSGLDDLAGGARLCARARTSSRGHGDRIRQSRRERRALDGLARAASSSRRGWSSRAAGATFTM